MPTECCVPGCTNRTGHTFPWSDPSRVKAWKVAVRRDRWNPTKHSVVCKSHFAEADYESKTASGTEPLFKRLKTTAVPHVFAWSRMSSVSDRNRKARAENRQCRILASEKQRKMAMQSVGAEETVDVCGSIDDIDKPPMERYSQTDTVSTSECSTQSDPVSLYTARRFAHDPAGIHFYTGLGDYEKFMFVLDTLGPASEELNYFHGVIPSLSVEDQFFLTLIKLRQSKTNFELSRMFSVHEASVTNIFVTWINFMAFQWGETDWWPSQDMVHFYAPSDFKLKFPTTRVIIDGTECPIMKPQEPLAQQTTFSSYKNRNTVKVLAGLSPGGLVSYISPAYGGAASDRQICERSSLMTQCCAGDSIMSDKGFNVQDLFESSMVCINIPSFFSKKNRMSGGAVLKDRKIASKRVHVERIIGLAKTYKILKKPMNQTESVLASQIIKVCFYLCNFRAAIVSSDA